MVPLACWPIYILLDMPGPIVPEARWPILMCGTWHDGLIIGRSPVRSPIQLLTSPDRA